MHKHGDHCGCWLGTVEDIDGVLAELGVDVFKQLDPLKDADFVTIFTQLKRKLQRAAKPLETRAVNQALNALDVDWPNLTLAQRDAAATAANRAIREATTRAPDAVVPILRDARVNIAEGTKRSLGSGRDALNIRGTLTQADRQSAARAASAQGNFVTDEYGRRAVDAERRARSVVSRGLEQGLGRDEISKTLAATIDATIIGRSPAYWDVIAASFMNRSRTFTQLTSMAEAAVDVYAFEAVLDRATTEQCRWLHGKRFRVQGAIDRMQRSDRSDDPIAALKNEEPWVQKGKDREGNVVLFTRDLQGRRTIIADVLTAGEGKANRVGVYRQRVSDAQLFSSGIPWPPLHGLCRSTILPVGV